MKAALIFILFASASMAQEFLAPQGPRREIVPIAVEPKPGIEGILKDIFVTRKPWQVVNPLAPASYGSGAKLVSRDFAPGTPHHSTTVTVFGVEW